MEADRKYLYEQCLEAATLGFGDDSLTKQAIEERCAKESVLFLDPDFPPVESSLYKKDPSGEVLSDGQPITFRRPRDFMDGSYDVFLGGIEPNDIRQGMLTDW